MVLSQTQAEYISVLHIKHVSWQGLGDRRTPPGGSLQWVNPADDELLENALNALRSSQGQTGKVLIHAWILQSLFLDKHCLLLACLGISLAACAWWSVLHRYKLAI